MSRMLPLCALTLAIVSALIAADPPKKADAPTKTTIALTVSPMAEPRPALRYTLLPELQDMRPGNPIHGYLKCFMEQNFFFFNKTSEENREKWLVMPLEDLPLKELKNYGGNALRNADYAARFDTPDWQILLELEKEGVDLLLPEVQQMRRLAASLKVRFRAEVAAKRFDAAIHTAQTMFALSRHLGEHPTIIGDLVGLAVAFVAIGPLDEMLQQPGCPNLYWALTDLPRPFIDLRKGMQGERAMFRKEFAPFDADRPLDAAGIDRVLKRFDEIFKGMQLQEGLSAALPPTGEWIPVVQKERPKSFSEVIRARVKDANAVTAARKRVASSGLAEERAKALPAIQILLLDAKNAFEASRDGEMKWANVSWPKAEAVQSKLHRPVGLFGPLVPTTRAVVRARTRLDQRFGLLRHVEAIRLYAAAHAGKLPPTLADIEVPLPNDPFTGKPFRYEVEAKTAVVRGTPARGDEKIAVFNIEYRVTIR